MGLPRVRFRVRRLMLLVAAIAVGLFLLREFGEGLPPRFVVRGIPARIARLRPGMTWEQTHEILGLEQSWLRGGTSAKYGGGDGGAHMMLEGYLVRPVRVVGVMARTGGGNPAPHKTFQSTATIHVWFRTGRIMDMHCIRDIRPVAAPEIHGGLRIPHLPRLSLLDFARGTPALREAQDSFVTATRGVVSQTG
jgi:hypothetical protein